MVQSLHLFAVAALALTISPEARANPPGEALAAQPATPQAAAAQTVDPAAVEAARRMGAALRALTSFEVRTEASLEEVIDEAGAKITLESSNHYRVRRPDAFVLESRTGASTREFWYDGRTFTVSLPERDFFAQTDAPPTIQGVLDDAYDRFGIALPLADIFTWGSADLPDGVLRRASKVGEAKIGGVDTEHFLFQTDALAWQVWISKGDQPLPRKVVITTLDDPARPSYSAVLDWTPSASFTADAFTFQPSADARPIALALIP